MNNACNLLRAQDTVAPTVFRVVFNCRGKRKKRRSERRGSGTARRIPGGSAASRWPPTSKGSERQGQNPANPEAAEGN